MDPPHFRAGDWQRSCESCTHFGAMTKDGQWGTCLKYDRTMMHRELCDSWTPRPEDPKHKARNDFPG